MPAIRKILITTPWFSPAFRAGGPVQSVINMVNNFKNDVAYYILTGNTDLNGEELNVKEDEWIGYNDITRVMYLRKDKRSKKIIAEVEKIQPDSIFIIGVYDWCFNVVPLYFIKNKRKIISARGMLMPGALRQKPLKKKMYFLGWKLFGLQKKGSFHATSEAEAAAITDMFGRDAKIQVAANYPRFFSLLPGEQKRAGVLNLASIALISPMKNHALVLEALLQCKMNIVYDIYGPVKDAGYFEICKKLIAQMPANVQVTIHGEILPDAVESSLAACHVFIQPSKSENYAHAIIEALSAGRPVITSRFTSWNDLAETRAGMNVELNTAAILFAIEKFALMTGPEFAEWQQGAFYYSRKAVNIKAIHRQYEKLFF